jgi:hypothetical protein
MLPPVTSSPDLAQLSDADLVERIETAWRAYEGVEARKASAWDYFRWLWGLSRRGPPGFSLTSLFNGPGSIGGLHPSLTLEPAARTYQALREIRDLTDELERRVARDKAQRT